ncbi:hypothetical protein AAY473_026737 [Plecturocebus cupreus]
MGSCYVAQAGLKLLGSRDPPTSVSRSARITGVSHCTYPGLFFKEWGPLWSWLEKGESRHWYQEIGFHHVGQAGHERLISSDLPAIASQSAGITGVSHYAQPTLAFLSQLLKHMNNQGLSKVTQGVKFCFVETRFHHVGQAGLELLISSDLPALVSKVLRLQLDTDERGDHICSGVKTTEPQDKKNLGNRITNGKQQPTVYYQKEMNSRATWLVSLKTPLESLNVHRRKQLQNL